MIVRALSKPASRISVTPKSKLLKAMQEARSYATWSKAAKELDAASGNDRWKERDRSDLYD